MKKWTQHVGHAVLGDRARRLEAGEERSPALKFTEAFPRQLSANILSNHELYTEFSRICIHKLHTFVLIIVFNYFLYLQ